MEEIDFKKTDKELYRSKSTPAKIRVPSMPFIMVNGKGNPNHADGKFSHAVGLLYSLYYTIKMSKKGGNVPNGHYKYVVPPLEGFWRLEGESRA